MLHRIVAFFTMKVKYPESFAYLCGMYVTVMMELSIYFERICGFVCQTRYFKIDMFACLPMRYQIHRQLFQPFGKRE